MDLGLPSGVCTDYRYLLSVSGASCVGFEETIKVPIKHVLFSYLCIIFSSLDLILKF